MVGPAGCRVSSRLGPSGLVALTVTKTDYVMATTLASINLFAQDVDRLKRFYTEGLGLTEDPDRSAPPGFYLLRAGSATLTLQTMKTPGAETGPAGSIELGFTVDDVAALAQRLTRLGYLVGRVQQMGWGTALDARDPEGHRLNLFRLRQ